MSERNAKWQPMMKDGRVANRGEIIQLGTDWNDLVRIVVAVFDLKGFTNFCDRAPGNKHMVVSAYMNGFLDWLNHRLNNFPSRPGYWKFLGDGVLLVWEAERDQINSGTTSYALMNACWNMVSGKTSYCKTFLPEFIKQVGKRWSCDYPPHLLVSLSVGHAMKYGSDQYSCEYIAECINIASRLIKFNSGLHFTAHSDLIIGPEPKRDGYLEKSIEIRGINRRVAIYVDEDEFIGLEDKTKFQNL